MSLLASRDTSGEAVDPLARWGFPLRCSPLPGPLLTRAWDRGLLWAPRGYDVVHAVSLAAPPVHHRPSETGRRPTLVVVVHDLAWRINPEATTAHGRRWHEAALQRALRRAGALVVPSPAVAEALDRRRGGTGSPGRHRPRGRPPARRPTGPAPSALLGRLGVTGPFLLSAGTLEPRKNLRRLVAAFAAARPSLPEPWPLVIVGPSGWGDGGLDLGDGRTVPPGVSMAGLVTDEVLAALYERCRAFWPTCPSPRATGSRRWRP